jgi:hypothetical protein
MIDLSGKNHTFQNVLTVLMILSVLNVPYLSAYPV